MESIKIPIHLIFSLPLYFFSLFSYSICSIFWRMGDRWRWRNGGKKKSLVWVWGCMFSSFCPFLCFLAERIIKWKNLIEIIHGLFLPPHPSFSSPHDLKYLLLLPIWFGICLMLRIVWAFIKWWYHIMAMWYHTVNGDRW